MSRTSFCSETLTILSPAEYTAELATALRTAGYDVDLVVDSGVLKARDLGERVESHLSSDGVAVVHVLSHGQYTADGGVYVVGSDATRLKETRRGGAAHQRGNVTASSTPMTGAPAGFLPRGGG